MQLRMAVRGPSGQRDIRVEGDPGCALDSVREQLAEIAGVEPGRRWLADGQVLAPDAVLGEPPLIEGAVLAPDMVGAGSVDVSPGTGIELRVVAGPDAGLAYVLGTGEVVIGRGHGVDLRLADAAVSRRHASISWRGLEVQVRDLGSSGGTWLDGRVVGADPVGMRLGAQLTIGASTLTLADSTGPGAASTPDGAGGLATNRAPRIIQPATRSEIVVPVPPPARDPAGFPWLATVLPLLVGIPLAWRFGAQALAFTVLSVAAVALTGAGEQVSRRKARRRAMADYRHELAIADIQIAQAVEVDAACRRDELPAAASLLRIVAGPSPRLWERRRGDHDMLVLRLGLADLPSRITIRRVDSLASAVTAPSSRSVPVALSLQQVGVIGLAGDRPAVLGLVRFIVGQVASLHSPRDVRLVVVSAGSNDDLAWTHWLPHTEATTEDCTRLVGLGPRQAAARISELAMLVDTRAAARDRMSSDGLARAGHDQLVVLVCDGARELRSVPGLSTILEHGPHHGVYSICLAPTASELPSECAATVLVADPSTGQIQVTEAGRPSAGTVSGELVPAAWAERFARAIAPLRDLTPAATHIPSSVRLLDLLRLEPLDPDVIAERWRAAPRSTVVTLGAGSDGPVQVDLAADGPHALVAGTTGSGKSEFLETMVAGLAIGNRPDELAIVLIDYKGGATFADCARLPHTVGLVTDLDGPLARRALVSLRAELSRRERLMRSAGVADIESLLRVGSGPSAADRLNRLVIIVDEFAALAEELPEFMTGLVALAQRGRSLGIHLVLATQRPAGVVSADIRANTNLRIALRMTDPAESQDVIDGSDAARIPRQLPGRAYVRVGAGVPIACQTAQVTTVSAIHPGQPTVTPEHWQSLGDPVRSPAKLDTERGPSDLCRLVTAIEVAGAEGGFDRCPSPWLPPLPGHISLDQLIDRAGPVPSPDRVAVGLCDYPASQEQRPLWFNLAAGKHWLIVGAAGSGKSTALRSMAAAITTTCSVADAHVYGLDCAGGAIAGIAALPHCGAVVMPDQPERGARLLARIHREVVRRQDELAAAGMASIAEQRTAALVEPSHQPSWLVLLIDGWDGFLRTYQELDYGRPMELLYRLLADGPAAGLTVVITGGRSTLAGRIGSLIANRLVLRLNDPADYNLAGVADPEAAADWPPGRGQIPTGSIETQVAIVDSHPSGSAQQAELDRIALGASPSASDAELACRAPFAVAALPAAVKLSEIEPRLAGFEPPERFWLPVGVGGDELAPIGLPLEAGQSALVAGPPGSGRSTTLTMAAQWYLSHGIRVAMAGPRQRSWSRLEPAGPGHDLLVGRFGPDDGTELLAAISNLGSDPVAVLVDDAEELIDSPLEAAVLACPHADTVRIIAGCSESMAGLYRGLVPLARRNRCGLLLGRYRAMDGELLGARIGASIEPRPGRALLIVNGAAVIPVQVALP